MLEKYGFRLVSTDGNIEFYRRWSIDRSNYITITRTKSFDRIDADVNGEYNIFGVNETALNSICKQIFGFGKAKVVVIDFDGTITKESKYPDIGSIRKDTAFYLNKMYFEGFYVIINTAREGNDLKAAEAFLMRHKVKYDIVNDNAPFKVEEFGNNCRKVAGDVIIDDKNLGNLPEEWSTIYRAILNQLITQ